MFFPRRRHGCFCLFISYLAAVCSQSESTHNVCRGIVITRLDTNEEVTNKVVVFDGDFTETPKSFSCGGEGWVWAPTAQTDYIGFMSELHDIGTYAFDRIDSLIHTNLMFQSKGGHKEGFYYCTNAINFGCFVGAFQRNSLMPRDVCVNHITHTSFEVSWSKVTFTEYVRGYDLTVMSEGKVVYRERFPLSSTAAYNKKISCLEPGKQYVVKIDALYSFVSDRQEFLKISNSIPVTTPLGKASRECVDEMKSPVVDAKPHLRTNGTVNVTWTTPNNIKPTKSIIRYRNVLSADTLEKVVEGSSTAVEINNLEMGATYMFSVAIYAASSSKRASHSVSSFSEPVYVTTYSAPRRPALRAPTAVTPHSVQISWSTDDTLDSQLPQKLAVTAVPSSALQLSSVPKPILVDFMEGSVTISHLLEDTSYTISVWAENSVGRSTAHSLKVQTSVKGLPEGPSTVTAYALNSTSVLLYWNGTNLLASQCAPSKYKLTVVPLEVANKDASVVDIIVHHPTSRHVVGNLLPYGKYRFEIRAICDNGIISQASEVVSRTHASAPTATPAVTISSFSSGAVISITSPSGEESNGIITSYKLQYAKGKRNSAVEMLTIPALSCGSRTPYVLTGLKQSSGYKLKLSACNEVNCGPDTNWKFFSTSN